MIEVEHLTKRFGSTVAVDDLSFEVRPGRVTGFLGPNGAGKSTTMRCMVGLDRAQQGETRFDGRSYVSLDHPMQHVGALLDAGYVHPSRSARNHLVAYAAATGLPVARVDEVLATVGLSNVSKRKASEYSLGMRQRLGLALALLGDPPTILADEPANGLDPEGILWVREFLKAFAAQGRTVFVSSHLLAEMAQMADDLVVIGRGRLLAQTTVADFVARSTTSWVVVRSPAAEQLARLLEGQGARVERDGDGVLHVYNAASADIGELAFRNQVVLHELATQTGSLEEAFLQATAEAQEFRTELPPPGVPV